MTIEKNIWADIQDGVTQGLAAAELVNDNKRAVNELVDVVNPLVDQVDLMESNLNSLDSQVDSIQDTVDGLGTASTMTNASGGDTLGTASTKNVATEAQVIAGTAGVLPDAEQVRRNHVAQVATIADLRALEPAFDGQQVSVSSYHAIDPSTGPVGGGVFYWDSTKDKSDHNGGTVIDPDKTFPNDWSNRASVEAWFSPTNVGSGCWVSVFKGSVDVTAFGAFPNFSFGIDNSIAINAALAVKNAVYIPKGNYIIHRPIFSNKASTIIEGDGPGVSAITVEGNLWQGITFSGKNYNAAIVITSGVQDSWIEGAVIQDLTLIGNSYSADNKIGIDFDNVCMRVFVRNVHVATFDKGIHSFKSWVHSYENVTVTDCVTNSMHFDHYANGFSFTGCTLYGQSVYTSRHLLIENACYGNSWTGGAIEKCNVAVTIRSNAQLNISGTDFEVAEVLAIENIDCPTLPSKIDSCAIIANPFQSVVGLNNGNLAVENCKIFNPGSTMTAPVYSVSGAGRLSANNNEYGDHSVLLADGGLAYGNDFGRYDFNKSARSGDKKVLDTYFEESGSGFPILTNALEQYTPVSESYSKTQVGNLITLQARVVLSNTVPSSGDYFTFTLTDVSASAVVVGSFIFSPSGSPTSPDCIVGTVVNSSGTCYLYKSEGGFLLNLQ